MSTLSDTDLFDLIELPVFVLAPDEGGRPVYVGFNRRAQELSGKTLADVQGKTAIDIFEGRLGERAYRRQCEAWTRGMTTTYETALPVKGKTMWVRTTINPVRDKDGALVQMVGTSVDITKQRERLEREAMARTLAQEMEEFVSMAAHDLRSPIANVRSLTDLLRDGFVDLGDGKLELIDALEEVSTKALELIGDVLAHATASNATEEVRTFDLADLCEDILGSLDPMRRHDLFLDQVVVYSDFAATQVVLRNLFDNAIKHANTEALMMEVAASETDDGKVRITVRDNGTGFPDPDKVFRNTVHGGVYGGFGLAGTRRLVTARGGTIQALPVPERQGAKVEFTLPGYLVREGGMQASLLVG